MEGKRLDAEKEKAKLYRQLYVAASFCVDPNYTNDREAVCIKRDDACFSLFGRGYKDLSNDEIDCVIQELQIESGFMDAGQLTDKNKKRISNPAEFIITQSQQRTLRMYAINCALIFADFSGAQFYDSELEENLRGEQVRVYAKEKFGKSKSIPKPIFTYLFTNWINPKLHQYMIEFGYKKRVVDPSKFHIEYLKQEQANKLIQKFAAIWVNASQRDCKPFQGQLSIN